MMILILLLAFAQSAHAEDHEGMQNTATKLERELQTACGRVIRVDVSDYKFSYDERQSWDYPGLEYAQVVGRVLKEACEKHPESKKKIAAIETLTFKRGSMGERKMVKVGSNLIHLSTRDPREDEKNKDDLVEEDLTRLLGIDFTRDFKKEESAAKENVKKEKEASDEKDRKEKTDKKNAEFQAKIKELTEWYQTEVKKITTKPDADMGPKLEELSKTYERKLDALQKSY